MTEPHAGQPPQWAPTEPAPEGGLAPIAAGPTGPAGAAGPRADASVPVQPLPRAPVRPGNGGGGRAWNVVLAVGVLIAVGGVAFAVGRATAPASAASQRQGAGFPNGGQLPGASFEPGSSFNPGGGGFPGGFGDRAFTVTGTVESIDGSTLTLKAADGQTITVELSSDTAYHAQAAASASDVTTGATVQVTLGGGLGGFGRGPNASVAPGASQRPQSATATDVTIVGD